MSASTPSSSSQISPTCLSLIAAKLAKDMMPITMGQPSSSTSATIQQSPGKMNHLEPIELPATSFPVSQQFRNFFSLANYANTTGMPSPSLPSSTSPSSAASIDTIQAQTMGGIQNFRGVNVMESAEEWQKLIRNFEQQNHCQNALQKHLLWEEEEKQRRKQALLFNKAISHEKRKFTQPISDFMVREVLKRKSHLVEHNTSRDLKFSEEKRKAWETVRDLLKERFAGFNIGIENIKSHWRYRKRKVSDSANEMRGLDSEERLREKLGNDVDFEIYLELKASNMLDHYDEESSQMPLSNDDEIGNGMLLGNDGISDSPLAGHSQNHQPPQQNGTMTQGMAQLLNGTAGGLPPSLFPLNVALAQLQNLLKAQTRQQEAITDPGANSNGNHQPIPGVNGGEELILGPLNVTLNGQLEDRRDGRKRAADSNAGELFPLVVNGMPNGQYKARKEGNEQQENGDSDEAGKIDEMAMECSMNKKGRQQLVAAPSSAAVGNGGNGMLDFGGQNNALIQAHIAAAISIKEGADLQKLATAEWLQATKSINELLPKVHTVVEKWIKN